jgi:multidrug transporter EmrE-like cation transporter
MYQNLLLLLVLTVSNVAAQLMLKKSVLSLEKDAFSLSNLSRTLPQILFSGYTITALLLLALGFVLFLVLISDTQLSVVYPIVISLTLVLILFAGRIFFGESLNSYQILGIGAIIIGIVLVLTNQG